MTQDRRIEAASIPPISELVISRELPFPPPGIDISQDYIGWVNKTIFSDTSDCGFGSSIENIWYQIISLEGNRGVLAAHKAEVGWVSQALGRLYGMSQEQLDMQGLAALLHDTGLVLLPHLANKSQKFTNREKKLSEKHPELGFEILEPMKLPSPVLQVVRNHHRDFEDYIDCPESERIFVDIVAISDVYAALRDTNRVYQETRTNEQARDEILQLMRQGERFNPEHRAMFEVFCQRIARIEGEYGEVSLLEMSSRSLL